MCSLHPATPSADTALPLCPSLAHLQVGCVQAFLEGVATAAGRMLSQFSPQLNVSQLQAYMFDREKRFSCQVGHPVPTSPRDHHLK